MDPFFYRTSGFGAFCIHRQHNPRPQQHYVDSIGSELWLSTNATACCRNLAGFFSLLLVSAAGLGALFITNPMLHSVLKYVGAAYLFFLAWKIASAQPRDADGVSSGQPFTWWQAALFQYANPKAWVMAVSSMTAFTQTGDSFLLSACLVVVVFSTVNIPYIVIWAGFGTLIGRWLRSPKSQRVFNVTMGILTASSVILIFT